MRTALAVWLAQFDSHTQKAAYAAAFCVSHADISTTP